MSGEELKIIVEADLLPEVLLKVIEAKKLLSQGKAKNSSEAARMAGMLRKGGMPLAEDIIKRKELEDALYELFSEGKA